MAESELPKQTVLAVDDIADNLALLSGILSSDYRVICANSGHKALELAKRSPRPDIILLDVMMPGLDGFSVCKTLKADYLTRDIPVIFVTSLDEVANESHGFDLGAVDYITKPLSPPIVQVRVKTHLALHNQNRALQEKVIERTKELEDSREAIIERLGRAAEYKDNETGKHVIRMSHYTYILALKAGMSKSDADMLKLAAPMHDIGKIGIPDKILQKPGKLDTAERLAMYHHTEYGANILGDDKSELLQMAKIVALGHHEKWDGSGYPNGISGDDIPLPARLVAIADVFDALTSVRPYKKAWAIDEAIDYMESCSGTSFDPELIPLLRQSIPEFLEVHHRFRDEYH